MTSSPLRKRNPVIADFYFPPGLPTAEDLPCSDGKPVDSELQNLLPNLLQIILADLWSDRPRDWLFSIDMGFYYEPGKAAVVPDGMLSLGIAPSPSNNLRLSYLLWVEKVLPLFVVEVISKTPGQERTLKKDIYESIGILYYLVYAPLEEPPQRFELYKLVAGQYVLQTSASAPAYWMSEIGLGIGAEQHLVGGIEREWLFWYDEAGLRYHTPSDRAHLEAQKARLEAQRADQSEQEKALAEQGKALADQRAAQAEQEKALADQRAAQADQRATQAEQQAAVLRQKLQELGIDPDLAE
jgi:Uma2 family endonuclease